MNVESDTLMINIESSAKDATSSLSSLILSLDKLTQSLSKAVNESGNFRKIKNNVTNIKVPYAGYGDKTSQLKNLGLTDKQLGKSYYTSNSAIKEGTQEINKYKLANGNLVTVIKKVQNGLEGYKITMNSTNNSIKNGIQNFSSFAKSLLSSFGKISVLAAGIGKFTENATSYYESLNLFATTLGNKAEDAMKFVNKFSDALYLNPADVMQYMGSFDSLIKGLGVGEEKAYLMSQNMTQLTYDLSSFKNIGIESAFEKLQSGLSGEIEPLRNTGIALSQATLQELAYSLGIDESVSSMNEAQKAQLRYIQIMRSSSEWQADMGKTLTSPANMLRIIKQQFQLLARAIGNVFIPVISFAIPYIMVITEVFTKLANVLANLVSKFFGIKIDFSLESFQSSKDGIMTGLEDIGDGADETKKKLNTMLAPFDKLNVVQNKNKENGSGDGIGNDDLGADLPSYNALAKLTDKFGKNIDKAKENLKNLIPIIGAIGLGIAGWKVSSKAVDFLDKIGTISNKGKALRFAFGLTLVITSATLLINGLKKLLNGKITKESIMETVLSSIGLTAGAALMASSLGYSTMSSLAIGLSVTITVVGITLLIDGISKLLKGKVTPENIAKTISGSILGVTGILLAFNKIKKLKKAVDVMKDADSVMEKAGKNAESFSTASSNTFNKLKSLVKNLALGLVVLTEVAAGALIFVGSIWLLGEGLKKVSEAWKPVLKDGDTVLTAIGLGTALLASIGLVTGLLGTIGGGPLILALAAGTLILVEIGADALLFIAEIWAIGKGLNSIGEAWGPVLENGDTIKNAIKQGTILLVAIGVVSAALGVATVASVGLLPLAIALGTKMLVDLGDATVKFINSLSKVANALSSKLAPRLVKLNEVMPSLNSNLKDYIEFMKKFAGYTVSITKSNILSGFAGAVDTFVGWFVKSPIQKFANNVAKTYNETTILNNMLRQANPELSIAIDLVSTYLDFITKLDQLTGKNSNMTLIGSIFVNMKKVGKNLVLGFVDGIRSEYNALNSILSNMLSKAMSNLNAYSYGYNFGRQLGNGISTGLKTISFPKLKATVNSKGLTAQLQFKAFAEGGYPTPGEMFFARENGMPEMVGRIGNRAAVANNDQIVEAVSQGVAKAVANSGNGNGKMMNIVYIGDNKVYEGYGEYVQRENDRYGTNVIRV